jgi:hypothetical protein
MTLEQLIEIAKEVEVADPFDWADVAIDEDEAYRLMAMNLISEDLTPEIMLATIVKLCVENLVLNLRLLQNETKVP